MITITARPYAGSGKTGYTFHLDKDSTAEAERLGGNVPKGTWSSETDILANAKEKYGDKIFWDAFVGGALQVSVDKVAYQVLLVDGKIVYKS